MSRSSFLPFASPDVYGQVDNSPLRVAPLPTAPTPTAAVEWFPFRLSPCRVGSQNGSLFGFFRNFRETAVSGGASVVGRCAIDADHAQVTGFAAQHASIYCWNDS
jgi:hypothetical protein